MTWRPIETAPRDGGVFLAFTEIEMNDGTRRAKYFLCRWAGDAWLDPDWPCSDEPTHWMPLPTPPQRADEEAE